ncbi:MAG: hypothetical protein WCX65_07350 [bacterium]
MQKPIDELIHETWALFARNLVLLVPMIAYWFVLAGFYTVVAVVVVVTNFLKIKDIAMRISGSASFPGEAVAGWLAHSVMYLMAMLFIVFLFQTLLSVLQSAGMGRMFARAATEGRTGLGDYFEGIGKFSGRAFYIAALKGGILMLPMLGISILMLIVSLSIKGKEVLPVLIVLFVFGVFGTIALSAIVSFLTFMWKPAVFIRDISAVDGLSEGFRFVIRRIGGVLIILLIWIAFGMVIGMPASLAQAFLNPSITGQNQQPGFTLIMLAVVMGVQFVTMIVRMLGMDFFVLMYYKYYADEWRNIDAAAEMRRPPVQPAFIADPRSLQGLRHEHIYQPESEQQETQQQERPESPPDESAPAEAGGQPEPDPKPKPGLPDGFC